VPVAVLVVLLELAVGLDPKRRELSRRGVDVATRKPRFVSDGGATQSGGTTAIVEPFGKTNRVEPSSSTRSTSKTSAKKRARPAGSALAIPAKTSPSILIHRA